jgi:hypothetical protein
VQFEIPPGERTLTVVKHAALALAGEAYVELTSAKGAVRVGLAPKAGADDAALRALAARFGDSLEAEAIREELDANGRALREHMIRLALRPESAPADADIQLSPEQQKELDRLIAEVEAEVAKEPGGAGPDPLGVDKTWEEKHGHDDANGAQAKK